MEGSCYVLNKMWRTIDKEWSSSLGLGKELISLNCKKKQLATKCYSVPPNWTDFLKRPRQRKMSGCIWLRIGISDNSNGLSFFDNFVLQNQ